MLADVSMFITTLARVSQYRTEGIPWDDRVILLIGFSGG
jgi:hypothetical protein